MKLLFKFFIYFVSYLFIYSSVKSSIYRKTKNRKELMDHQAID